jgi:hypothetical protein
MTMSVGDTSAATEFEGIGEPESDEGSIRGRSLRAIAWRRLRQDKVAMTGGIVCIILILIAIFAKYLCAWYGSTPNASYVTLTNAGTQMPIGSFGLDAPSSAFWLGDSGLSLQTNALLCKENVAYHGHIDPWTEGPSAKCKLLTPCRQCQPASMIRT